MGRPEVVAAREALVPLLQDAFALAQSLEPMRSVAADTLARAGACTEAGQVVAPGTPFTKLTFAFKNATPVHVAHENYGLTILVVVAIGKASLHGGSHVLFSNAVGAEGRAVVVRDWRWGCVLMGSYADVMHANLAVTNKDGDRLCVTAYCGAPMLRKQGAL